MWSTSITWEASIDSDSFHIRFQFRRSCIGPENVHLEQVSLNYSNPTLGNSILRIGWCQHWEGDWTGNQVGWALFLPHTTYNFLQVPSCLEPQVLYYGNYSPDSFFLNQWYSSFLQNKTYIKPQYLKQTLNNFGLCVCLWRNVLSTPHASPQTWEDPLCINYSNLGTFVWDAHLKFIVLGSSQCQDSDGQGTLDPVILMFECLYLFLTLYLRASLPSPSILHLYQALWPHWSSDKGSLISPPCQAIMPLLLFGSLPRATACFILQPLVPSVPLSQTACVELGAGWGLETTSNKTLESLAQISWSRFNFPKFSLKSVLSLYCFTWLPMQYKSKDLVINFCSFLQPYLQLPLGHQIFFLSEDWRYKGWIHSTLRESRKESFVP